MNRSDFIKSLGLASGGLILPGKLLSSKSIKIYDNYVRGMQHYAYFKIKKELKIGDIITLRRDAENIYDSFAIEVLYENHKLGYIAAYENIVLANMMDSGVELKSLISQINPKRSILEALAIEVYAEIIIPTQHVIDKFDQQNRADDAKDLYRSLDYTDYDFK